MRLSSATRRRGWSIRLAVALLALPGALLALAAACHAARGGGEAIRRVDDDGDGRDDRFVTLGDDGQVLRAVEAADPGSSPPRTVVLAVDAIPHELFARLQRAGRFAAFFPASEMIAPFPSLTDVAFTDLLRTEPPAAYEDRFFVPEENRMGGGLGDRISGDYRALAPFHQAFDWEAPRFWGGFVYLEPFRVAQIELDRIETVLRDSDDPELILYLGATDGLGHEEGWAALEEHLVRIDRMLTRWMAAGGAERRVVLLSDHGMTAEPTTAIDLEAILRRAGFRLGERIETRDDVVAPAWGLIGSIQLYAACGREEEVARAVAAAPEVEFAVWQDGERRGAVDGDGPLDLASLPAEAYPDLPRRARRSLALTRNPASVIASLAPGAHYGMGLFEPFVSMEGTHGSARRRASVGFVASNVDRTPPILDAREVRPWLGLSGEGTPFEPAPYRCVAP